MGTTTAGSHPTWPDAYQIERELILLQEGPRLEQTVRDLLDRADAEKNPDAAAMRKSYEALLPRLTAPARGAAAGDAAPGGAQPPPGGQPATLTRAQLVQVALNILERLQWEEAKRYRAVPLQKHAIHRVVSCAIVIFLFFIAPYAYSDYRIATGHADSLQQAAWLPLWTALTSGLLGAFFSRLRTIQATLSLMSLEEVESTGTLRNLCLRGAVGMLGALIVFFFLKSELIAGTLFPTFSDIAKSPQPGVAALPNAPLAMLVMWSFIAGFSERLVPNILAKTETQMEAAAANVVKTP